MMPFRDGTGPLGFGARTGRGLGPCKRDSLLDVGVKLGTMAGLGYGIYGCGRRYGRRILSRMDLAKLNKDDLKVTKDMLEKRLEELNQLIQENKEE